MKLSTPALIVLALTTCLLLDVGCKGLFGAFPRSCDTNEEIEVSGNYEGTGPIITSVGANCKLHIKSSKLKGSTLIKSDAPNLELTLENVTIETTDTMVQSGSGAKVTINGSTLTATNGSVFDGDALDMLEIVNSTIESKTGLAIKAKTQLAIRSTQNAKIRGKRGGVESDASNIEVSLKKASEITSSDGVAIRTTSQSSVKVDADGGKIEGAAGGIFSVVDVNITGRGLTISSNKGSAVKSDDTVTLDMIDGSILSNTAAAIDSGNNLALKIDNTTIQGGAVAINAKSNLNIKATKKTRIVATIGDGIVTQHNPDITLNDSSIEAKGTAVRAALNMKLKLLKGARVAGKKGGIYTTHNLEVDGSGATIDGGSGPGIVTSSNLVLLLRNGLLKGVPAFQSEGTPTRLAFEGTTIDGEQKVK